ncbi:zinc-dependent alcohol dehydrogenase family protein [Chitinophaga nivalis]|uniref:NAD(P)-dependent alcohol dehydrogenase n=1 Tax=Chitinophaga nivalis TaxID=2991709 RepID=A0ABT3IP99_9BACT|nr:NAD(P)-dependent alcohol dehydrogenase [Chitinophaga nivalis]MCW3464541.1 NAD(P)-dependent alcohol dehydrogenase [Chitinophaga nivalis]MCW3485768.1 NAD(P)-dependent alcohol dehydrogenase [Chitinophaga nivalis]
MKAVRTAQTGIAHLAVTDLPKPVPQEHEVLIRIKAVSLNYLDIILANGDFGAALPMPYTPASDGAGIVEAVGTQVTTWQPGDRVAIHYVQRWISGNVNAYTNAVRVAWQTQGVLAEYVCIPAYGLVKIPAYLTYEEAATLPIAGLTAWEALINQAGLRIGQTVLTQGTGGVSIFALQLAKAAGARVIATTSSDQKAERLLQLGADHVINYHTYPEWPDEVKKLTAGEGVDITLDIAGTATIDRSIRSVKPHGFVGTAGFIGGSTITLDITRHLNLNFTRIQGFAVGNRESFEAMIKAMEVTQLHPVIDRVFALEEVQAAYQYVADGKHLGKVVITL